MSNRQKIIRDVAIVWGGVLVLWFLISLMPSAPAADDRMVPRDRWGQPVRRSVPDTPETRAIARRAMESAASEAARVAEERGKWSDDIGYVHIFRRSDPWGERLCFRAGPGFIEVRSSGADRNLHSDDDLVIEVPWRSPDD